MTRLCVDCKEKIGQRCPYCGDVRHKAVVQLNGDLRCGACRRVFNLELATGGFCESCLSRRLARCKELAEVHR